MRSAHGGVLKQMSAVLNTPKLCEEGLCPQGKKMIHISAVPVISEALASL